MLKPVTDSTKLVPGTEIKVGRHFGRVICLTQHERHGTVVHYRDLYSGAQKVTLLADVRVETAKRKVRSAKYAHCV